MGGDDGQGFVGVQVDNAEFQGRQTPGVVSKSAINACALIIVVCCDRVVVFHFSTQLLELAVRQHYNNNNNK